MDPTTASLPPEHDITAPKLPGVELPEILKPAEAALLLRLAPQTLAKWRCEKSVGAPPYVQLGGRRIGYMRRDLLAWLESRRRRSTSEVV